MTGLLTDLVENVPNSWHSKRDFWYIVYYSYPEIQNEVMNTWRELNLLDQRFVDEDFEFIKTVIKKYDI